MIPAVNLVEENNFYNQINFLFGDDPRMGFMNHGYHPIDPRIVNREDIVFKNSASLYLKLMSFVDRPVNSLLDIGCGRGGGLRVIKDYYDIENVHGIDYNWYSIQYCRKAHPGIQFNPGDARDLKYDAETFDVILNVESSGNYNPRLEDFFSGVHRILKPDGIFAYTDIFPDQASADYVESIINKYFRVETIEDTTQSCYLSCLEMSEDLLRYSEAAAQYLQKLAVQKAEVYLTGKAIYNIFVLKKV